mmetsp:Transcript_17809/g.45170  ORF Transcript_17809/g.45170 Transcript_17809/m.45170 type:complete len:91 (+) Transcript_17809:427-699(+)
MRKAFNPSKKVVRFADAPVVHSIPARFSSKAYATGGALGLSLGPEVPQEMHEKEGFKTLKDGRDVPPSDFLTLKSDGWESEHMASLAWDI